MRKINHETDVQTDMTVMLSKCIVLIVVTNHLALLSPVAQTEEYMDTLDFEMASLFCQRALDVESDNLQALDMLGHICSELGDTQKAKEISLMLSSILCDCVYVHCCQYFDLIAVIFALLFEISDGHMLLD